MKIQINTDKSVEGSEKFNSYITSRISEKMSRYSSHITRVEVHISDENGKKEGPNDIRCLIEARLEGRQPIAVSNQDETEEQAVSGALEKLRTSLETVIGRLSENNRDKSS
jgi:ribosome-associated translation inhibitor RaiA